MSAANALSTDGAKQGSLEGRPTEPSMEDILASIRRIIADDQSRQVGAPSMTTPKAPAVANAPSASSTPAPSLDPAEARAARMPGLKPSAIQATRPALRPSADSALAAPALRPTGLPHLNPPAMTPMFGFDRSVIDEIASVGVASALQASQVGVAPVVSLDPAPSSAEAAPAPALAVPDVAPAVSDVAPVIAAAAPADIVSPITVAAMSPAPGPSSAEMTPDVVAPPAPSTEPDAAEPAPPPSLPEATAIPTRPDPTSDPLVSPEAVATIESSFHALATTVFMQNTGMVEGLVRDMMRPMLKSWLDDNLPTIVERLVRIEIERVARGGRS